jgi:D-tagatose 6-phosphate 4-epimerase
MTTASLLSLASDRKAGRIRGVPSVCSAHPVVLSATPALYRDWNVPALIEATCNQVNHEGGYTGMTPADFRAFVLDLTQREGFDPAGLILGGDHLGPNPWTALPAAQAMDKACTMVAAYAAAGFTKIHLDASMACADDPTPLPDAEIARRNAVLAAVAETHASSERPVYVIGTEVPVPGGALEAVQGLSVTTPEAALTTVDLHRQAFSDAGVSAAFARVVGLIAQPGVEFGTENVVAYEPAAAQRLGAGLRDLPMLFEAHSTDYQTPQALVALVKDGFGILKVGPGLTFALREALYGLDHCADLLFLDRPTSLRSKMEAIMRAEPVHWQKYCHGSVAVQALQRHFGYSDRIRYYWQAPVAQRAVADLLGRFGPTPVPETLVSQHLAAAWPEVTSGRLIPTAPALLRAAVTRSLAPYLDACFSQT